MGKRHLQQPVKQRVTLAAAIITSALLSGCFDGDRDESISKPTTTPTPDNNTIELVITTSEYAAINRAITLSAAGSTTENGSALTYQWQIVEEPEKDAGNILAPSSRNTRLLALVEGNYTIKLTVSDGEYSRSGTKTLYVDYDADGIPSSRDLDIDGDGTLNVDDQFPKDITEWIDSDGNGVGNYAQSDEDGDGKPDQSDAYPFDPEQQDLFVYSEMEFNGNLYPNGNQLNRSYPFAVKGVVESGSGYEVDTDYFLFDAKAGDIITLLLHKTNKEFAPSLALLSSAGASLPTVKVDWSHEDYLAVSSRITADGSHAFSVADINNAASEQFSYRVSVFKDSDMDGLSDDTELALGMQPTNPDSDGDGILDGLEQLLSAGDVDQDGDQLPAWWDLDSDGDLIDDSVEGVQDIDGDGVANFLDTDSDGNEITDDVEIGFDPILPEDSDNDAILDFVDTDDDNDSLKDINDNDRLSPLEQAEPGDKEGRLVVTTVTVITTDGSHAIEGVARRGDTIRLEGEGFGTTPMIAWQQGTELLNLVPQVDESGVLTFTVPQKAQSGEIKVSNGRKISYPHQITVVDADSPLLFDVEVIGDVGYAFAGESITLQGINLSAPSVRVNLNGVELIPTSVSNNRIRVTLPLDAASGVIAVVSDEISNRLPVEVRQQTGGSVVLPSGSTLAFDQLTAEFLGSSDSAVAANGSFVLPTRNQGATTVHLFAPEQAGREPAIFLSGVVLPGQGSIEISPYTMAAGLVYTSMGLEATIHADDQRAVMDVLLNSTRAFGDYLDEKLGQDPYYLEDYRRADFTEMFLKAIETAGSAVDSALSQGQIRQKTAALVSAKSIVAYASQAGGAEVTPQPFQQDFGVSFQDAGDSVNGKIDIENDTMMFADYKLLNAYNGKIIRDYANSYFSSDLLAPQSGIFSFYNANMKTEDLKHRSADLRLYTPGFKGEVWHIYKNSPSYKLAVRTFMSQAFVPVVNTVVGLRMTDSTTSTVLDILFQYGLVDAVESGWSKGTVSGFAEGVEAMIKKSEASTYEAIVKAVAVNQGPAVVKKMAVALGMKLTPWGSAATVVSVGGTAVDLGKLATDIATTSSYLEFRVNFPISVEEVTPAVIMVDGEPKDVALKGQGLDPVIKGSIFGATTHKPSVTFTDSKQEIHTDDAPTYESYIVGAGLTAPVSPLKVRLPADYLDKAESPLSVKLSHHRLDRDPFVDDLVEVKLDTQFTIELVKELTLSALDPSTGAWGETVTISGAGFSRIITDNRVFFTGDEGQPVAAMITGATPSELTVVVPNGAETGDVWAEVVNVNGTQQSNTLPFELEQQTYTFTFGDNGAANDDTYALYVNGQLIRTMASPSRSVSADVPLTPGVHQVELHGITAPDRIGTYYVSFPAGVTLISGDAMTGSDLTAGKVKRYSVEVQPVAPAKAGTKSLRRAGMPVPILWDE